MTRVSTTLSADASAYIREMQKINAELQKNTQHLEKLAAVNNRAADEAERASKTQESSLAKLAPMVTGLVASYVSWQGVMRLISGEMQNQLEMQQKMLAAQKTVESAERTFALNVGDPGMVAPAREAVA